MNQKDAAQQFRNLHIPGQPLILFNIWDAGSAKAVAAGGARAIATGSWSVANANGYSDGEAVPFDLVIENLTRISRSVELPVTVDIESGYGKTPEEVAASIVRTIKGGAVGCNIEDSFPESGQLRGINDQTKRIQHARLAANTLALPYFINARTDIFFQPNAANPDEIMVAHALERAKAYADAGADGLFVPGLKDLNLIALLAANSPLPLNIMAAEKSEIEPFAKAGVARVSFGPVPYRQMMRALESAAHELSGMSQKH